MTDATDSDSDLDSKVHPPAPAKVPTLMAASDVRPKQQLLPPPPTPPIQKKDAGIKKPPQAIPAPAPAVAVPQIKSSAKTLDGGGGSSKIPSSVGLPLAPIQVASPDVRPKQQHPPAAGIKRPRAIVANGVAGGGSSALVEDDNDNDDDTEDAEGGGQELIGPEKMTPPPPTIKTHGHGHGFVLPPPLFRHRGPSSSSSRNYRFVGTSNGGGGGGGQDDDDDDDNTISVGSSMHPPTTSGSRDHVVFNMSLDQFQSMFSQRPIRVPGWKCHCMIRLDSGHAGRWMHDLDDTLSCTRCGACPPGSGSTSSSSSSSSHSQPTTATARILARSKGTTLSIPMPQLWLPALDMKTLTLPDQKSHIIEALTTEYRNGVFDEWIRPTLQIMSHPPANPTVFTPLVATHWLFPRNTRGYALMASLSSPAPASTAPPAAMTDPITTTIVPFANIWLVCRRCGSGFCHQKGVHSREVSVNNIGGVFNAMSKAFNLGSERHALTCFNKKVPTRKHPVVMATPPVPSSSSSSSTGTAAAEAAVALAASTTLAAASSSSSSSVVGAGVDGGGILTPATTATTASNVRRTKRRKNNV